MSSSLTRELSALHTELGITAEYELSRKLPFHPEAIELIAADNDPNGQVIELTPEAAKAWAEMKAKAETENDISLWLESGFRSFETQASLIRQQLKAGDSLAKTLSWIAAPGFSEHHSGKALDIACPGHFPVTQDFQHSKAYDWLLKNAPSFHFRLSYPPENPYGIIFEPWHWYFNGPTGA